MTNDQVDALRTASRHALTALETACQGEDRRMHHPVVGLLMDWLAAVTTALEEPHPPSQRKRSPHGPTH